MTFFVILIILIIIILSVSIKIVRQQTAFTVETLGKFNRVIMPGLGLVIPFIETTGKKVNLSTLNMDLSILAITSDKVNIMIDTTLIYRIVENKIYEAAYLLDNPTSTIKVLVENSIRAFVSGLTHEEVIRARDEMTSYLVEHLSAKLFVYGYQIESFQFKDINLPKEITDAMSRVVASKRLQEAAQNEAEAEYIKMVKKAQAQKETRFLQGQGLALERKAVIDGLSESIKELQSSTGVTASSVMTLILTNQYIDMLRTVSTGTGTKVVFLNSSASGLDQSMQQFSELMKGEEVQKVN
jgi:regulator of protease activity HflC (stomatin/prohibitin superfamily)